MLLLLLYVLVAILVSLGSDNSNIIVCLHTGDRSAHVELKCSCSVRRCAAIVEGHQRTQWQVAFRGEGNGQKHSFADPTAAYQNTSISNARPPSPPCSYHVPCCWCGPTLLRVQESERSREMATIHKFPFCATQAHLARAMDTCRTSPVRCSWHVRNVLDTPFAQLLIPLCTATFDTTKRFVAVLLPSAGV